jgi:hypothetical protein
MSHVGSKQETLSLDCRVGGFGDIWMRLSALYSLTALVPGLEVYVAVPDAMLATVRIAWPDRWECGTSASPDSIQFNHLGILHVFPMLIKGRKFISPSVRIIRKDRKSVGVKHKLNDFLVDVLNQTNLVRVPPRDNVDTYQGFHEFTAIQPFCSIPYNRFVEKARMDFAFVRQRLHAASPAETPDIGCLVFPSGTGHQIMPPDWAKKHLQSSTFAFFLKDTLQKPYREFGLNVTEFGSIEELLILAGRARTIIATDSFPSHVCQSYTDSTVVALTQQPRTRIVHPAFDGTVVDSVAPCFPCLNMSRAFGSCARGRNYCLTWNDELYTRDVCDLVRSNMIDL